MTRPAHICPACATPLVSRRSGQGQIWVCPTCSGCLVGLAILRKGTDLRAVGRFWTQAVERPCARRCPICCRALATARIPDGPELDGCRTCFMVWCDGGELEQLPPARPDAVAAARQSPVRSTNFAPDIDTASDIGTAVLEGVSELVVHSLFNAWN